MSRRPATENQPGFLQSLLNCNLFCCCNRIDNSNVDGVKKPSERTPINGSGNQIAPTIQQSYTGPHPGEPGYKLFEDPLRYERGEEAFASYTSFGFHPTPDDK